MAIDGSATDPKVIDLHTHAFDRLGLPIPPSLVSDRIKGLLSKGLLKPATLSPAEIQELCASVVHHMATPNPKAVE